MQVSSSADGRRSKRLSGRSDGSLPSSRRRRQRRAHSLRTTLATTLVLLVLVPGTGMATGEMPSQGALDRAQQRAGQLEREARDAAAEQRAVERRLDELEEELREAEAILDEVTAEFEAADLEARAAADRAQAAAAELEAALEAQAENQEQLGSLARDTFKYGLPASSPIIAVMSSTGVASDGAFADRLHYLQRGVGERAIALERSEALAVEVAFLSERAQQEADEAEHALELAEEVRDRAAEAHANVAVIVSETSEQLELALQLVAQLETEQQQVDEQIEELEERIAAERAEAERLERERREREERERRERERREREAAERRAREQAARAASSSSGGGGGGSTDIRPGPTPSLVTVGGITVASSLGPQLKALLDHARADGIVLGGHGYRSPEVTARLRVTNGCPDVHTSPSSSCRVPTARPGESEHEKGLAVDFTYQGRTICFPRAGRNCNGNAAFDWLKANAGRYGLKNLPSEAWHWSTTGR